MQSAKIGLLMALCAAIPLAAADSRLTTIVNVAR
jgi:hypothetical protein